MSNNDGLFTDRDSFNPQVSNIPLTDVDTRAPGQNSVGSLVKDATSQISSLIRSEVELAKTEVASSAKKAGIAVGLFGAAGVILAYSSFFLFFTLAEAFSTFLPRWLSFLIVFLFMLVLVATLALVGVKQIKGAKKPEKTIESLGELKSVLPSGSSQRSARGSAAGEGSGLYT